MTSATLSNKNTTLHNFRSIFIWSLKKHKAMAIIYSVLLIFSGPIISVMINSSIGQFNTHVAVFTFGILSTGCAIIMALIVPTILTDYLHSKRKADVFGSLPCTRRTLFFARYCTGLAIVLVPYIINMAISALLSIGCDFSHTSVDIIDSFGPYNGGTIVLMLGALAILAITASYSFTSFISVCCGTTSNTVLSTILINIAYPIAISMISTLGSTIIPGVHLSTGDSPIVANILSPFTSIFEPYLKIVADYAMGNNYNFFLANWQFFLNWAIIIGGSIVLSYFFCARRKTESAQNSFAYKTPSIIIRFVASAAVGLMFALIFSEVALMSNRTKIIETSYASYVIPTQAEAWTIFAIFIIAFVITAFVVHIFATTIFNKGFRGFVKSLISYAAVVLVVCIVFTAMAFGGFGADKHVPNADEVNSVTVSYSEYSSASSIFTTQLFSLYEDDMLTSIEATDDASIEAVTNLHQKIVDNIKNQYSMPYTPNIGFSPEYYVYGNNCDEYNYITENTPQFITLTYNMKNGTTVEREYDSYYYYGIDIVSELAKIEYNKANADLEKLAKFDSRKTDYLSIELESKEFYYNSSPKIKREKIANELLDALQNDINDNLNETPNDFTNLTLLVAYRMYGENKNTTVSVKIPYSYERTLMFLSQNGYCAYTSVNQFYDEKAEEQFSLSDSISKTTLKDSTEIDASKDIMFVYFADKTFIDDLMVYSLADTVEDVRLYCRVVYTDKKGNLYYYDDKYSDYEKNLFDDLSKVSLSCLIDKKDSSKEYTPYAIQFYTDDKNIHFTPVNLDTDIYGNYISVYCQSEFESDINGETYIFCGV